MYLKIGSFDLLFCYNYEVFCRNVPLLKLKFQKQITLELIFIALLTYRPEFDSILYI